MGGATSSVASKMAFFRPNPPSYGVVDEEEPPSSCAAQGTNVKAAAEEDACKVATRRVAMMGVRWSVEARRVRTRQGSEIIAMYVRQPGASLTVLFSHGNAADLGNMYGTFIELSACLHVNLVGEVEECLLKVEQSPPESTSNAMRSATEALDKKEPVGHTDPNVRLAVASCI